MSKNPLLDEIIAEIRMSEPLSLARYMQLCLSHPKYGYYITQNPLGQDFTTSPEISQIFGEVIGVWAYLTWHKMGSPQEYNLVEIGAGRGTLMKDALRVLGKTKPQLHIVDINPVLRAIQHETLSDYHVTWHESLDNLPDMPTILIGNEFLDCLPINQYVKQANQWFEKRVGEKDGKLYFGLTPTFLEAEGDFIEKCPEIDHILDKISHFSKIKAIFIDYGYNNDIGFDSLQAMQNGLFVNPLDYCGYADLTAHVDFNSLRNLAEKHNLKASNIENQHDFMIKYGAIDRLKSLISKNPDQTEKITGSLARLLDNTSPDKMGMLFKIIEIGT